MRQSKRKARPLPRGFLPIGELAAHFGVTQAEMRAFLIDVRVMLKIDRVASTIDRATMTISHVDRRDYLPSDRAIDQRIAIKKDGAKSGYRSTYLWRVAYIEACWRNAGRPGRTEQ